jgi:signal transduction histidine kinase
VTGHLTVRARLTLLYGAMFFLAGALLVGTTYLLARHTITAGLEQVNRAALGDLDKLPADKPFGADAKGNPQSVGDVRAKLMRQQARLRDQALDDLLGWSALAALTTGVLSLGAGWVMAGRVMVPLQRITGTARTVASRNLGERIRLEGPEDEFKELADTFDAMLDRLDRAFEGQRRFVANASHELRTPLAVTRTLMQVAMTRPDASSDLRSLGATLLDVNTRQRDLTEGLLALAQAENSLTDIVPVDLADPTRRVAAELLPTAASADVDLRVDAAPALTAGDPVLLELLVRNLAANGLRYNRPGGWLHLSTGTDEGVAWFQAENTADRVLAPTEAEPIFEPFHRLDARQADDGAGVGLGLSIVRSVAEAHGGTARARPRPEGGLVLRVELPARTDHTGPHATSAGQLADRHTTRPSTRITG